MHVKKIYIASCPKYNKFIIQRNKSSMLINSSHNDVHQHVLNSIPVVKPVHCIIINSGDVGPAGMYLDSSHPSNMGL